MRTFELKKNYYDETELFKNTTLTLEDNSITCLIGCNGSGKSTILQAIKNNLNETNAYELKGKFADFRNLLNELYDIKYSNDIYLDFNKNVEIFNSEEDTFIKKLNANFISTGEEICNRLEDSLQLLEQTINNKENKGKSLFIFFDDCDAGTSIDRIIIIKSILNLISQNCKRNNITYYIILTANTYELCRDIDCIFVSDLSHVSFNSYEEYKEFILTHKNKGN